MLNRLNINVRFNTSFLICNHSSKNLLSNTTRPIYQLSLELQSLRIRPTLPMVSSLQLTTQMTRTTITISSSSSRNNIIITSRNIIGHLIFIHILPTMNHLNHLHIYPHTKITLTNNQFTMTRVISILQLILHLMRPTHTFKLQ